MAFAITQTVFNKLERRHNSKILDINKTLRSVCNNQGQYSLQVNDIVEMERPPILELPEYHHC